MDPYELQVFQEQYSLNLKDNKQPKLFDEVSVATSNQYKGLKNQKAKKVAKYRRETSSLPRYIKDNQETIQFGITTLPSDNMNMVMNNEFGHDFVKKMMQRKTIEQELEKIAHLQ